MSWLFSQALVEASLVDISSDGEQSVQSNGNPTQLAYLQPDKMTDFSRLSRFGMTFKPLTVDRGEALLMSYLEAFPAKTSALQDEETDLTENDQECGGTWRGSLAKFDPDSCSWKTAQCSLFGEEQESLQTLPRSGMTRNGWLSERQTLALRTRETGFGLWPTPLTQDSYERSAWKIIAQANEGGKARMTLTRKVKYLEKMKSTVQKWTTPTAHNAKETNSPSEAQRNTPTLAAQVGGALNPTWVEWLMGWPLGWTDLKPLEMDKFQQWQQKHSGD